MQKNNVCDLEFDMVLSAALTCVAEGLDSKECVKAEIKDYVRRHYDSVEDITSTVNIPCSTLELLHKHFGIEFDVHDGRLVGVTMAPTQNERVG